MRCYNGCPDAELQSSIDANIDASKRLRAVGANVTYFPAEGMWLVFRDNRPIGNFHESKVVAANTYLASVKVD